MKSAPAFAAALYSGKVPEGSPSEFCTPTVSGSPVAFNGLSAAHCRTHCVQPAPVPLALSVEVSIGFEHHELPVEAPPPPPAAVLALVPAAVVAVPAAVVAALAAVVAGATVVPAELLLLLPQAAAVT